MKGQGKELEEPAPAIKSQINKFNKRKPNPGASNNGSSTGLDQLHMSEKDINVSTTRQRSFICLLLGKHSVLHVMVRNITK